MYPFQQIGAINLIKILNKNGGAVLADAAAFATQQAAEKAKAGKEGQLITWDELYKKIK